MTAAFVCGPKTPSTTTDGFGVRRSARCARLTAFPVEPCWMVGCPGFAMILSLLPGPERTGVEVPVPRGDEATMADPPVWFNAAGWGSGAAAA